MSKSTKKSIRSPRKDIDRKLTGMWRGRGGHSKSTTKNNQRKRDIRNAKPV